MQDTEDRLAALEAALAAQRAEIARLRAEIGATRTDDRPEPEVSRRHIVRGLAAAALGAAAGAVATGRAEAADGDALVVGDYRTATSRTAIVYNGGVIGEYGFGVTDGALGEFPVTAGIAGHCRDLRCGVLGYATDVGTGVMGWSDRGDAVYGVSTEQTGVSGSSLSHFGVRGYSGGSTGVVGQGRIGVFGGSSAGTHGARGIGVSAKADAPATALSVDGAFRYTRAGVARIAAGTRSTSVRVPGLTARSLVIATIQASVPVSLAVSSAGVMLTSNPTRIALRLTANAPSTGLSVAWFVVDRP